METEMSKTEKKPKWIKSINGVMPASKYQTYKRSKRMAKDSRRKNR